MKITQEKLNQILEAHGKWYRSDGAEGERADLRRAYLQGADLRRAYLQGATCKEQTCKEHTLIKHIIKSRV